MDENEVFENHQYIMVKRLLIVMCIWPYQNKKLKLCGRTCVIFAVLTTLIPEMIRFYEEIYEDNRDLQIITEKFSVFLFFQMILSKLGKSTYTAKKLQHLYEIITKDYNKTQGKTAMDGLRDFARISIIIYASYMFTALFFYVSTPQTVPAILHVIWPLNESRHKIICYYAEYFIDQDEYLYILVFHTYVVVAVTLIFLVAVDTSSSAFTYPVIRLFSVLNFRFKYLNKWVGRNANREEQRLHNFIIHTIKNILYLFFVNSPDQKFHDSSDDLAGSIYSSPWYNLSTRTPQLMRFMMMRCLILCQLTADLLLQMNFAFCGFVLTKSVSFFMIVYSLN